MHKSQDLHKVIGVVFNQMESLGLVIQSAQISDNITDTKTASFWVAADGQVYPDRIHLPVVKNAIMTRFIAACKNGESFYTQQLSKKQKDKYFHHYFENSSHKDVPRSRQDLIFSYPGMGFSIALGEHTALSIMRYDGILYQDDENEIVRRFFKVFEQSYTRFLDLQKAEAQAREANIEAALERVRARAMAMNKSEELAETSSVLFEQIGELGLIASRAGFATFHDDGRFSRIWGTARDSSGKAKFSVGEIQENLHPLVIDITKAWREKKAFANIMLEGKEWSGYYKAIEKTMNFPTKYREELLVKEKSEWYNTYFFEAGHIFAITQKALTEDESYIMQRFAQAFDLTYKRFLDLKLAEAQAREAKIEAALERVRSRSMAMHKSDELHDVVKVLYREFKGLNLWFHAVNIFLRIDNSKDINLWAGAGDLVYPSLVHWPYVNLRMHDEIYKSWGSNKIMHTSYTQKEKERFLEVLFKIIKIPKARQAKIRAKKGMVTIGSFLNMTGLQLIKYANVRFTEEEQSIVLRFSIVFEQIYTRFLDLQKAEAQTREAEIETALERLRAASMAMHHSEELSSTSFVMFQEIVKLGIRPWNFAFFIFHGQSDIADCFSSDKTGFYPIMVLPHKPDQFLRKTYEDWRAKKTLTIQEAKGRALKKHQEYMKTIPGFDGIIKQRRTAGVNTLKKMIFNNAHFKYGYIMINTLEPQTDFWDILQRIAKVFEQTYRRFLDLKKAEVQAAIAKKQSEEIELAYENLKATQTQLIQSEKMASLGELTAGIAHEIQNPLNFVNNFSDVSVELIDETFEELEKNDVDMAKEVLNDLKGNLEKIVHHGGRASSIVKGMLDHSRASTGEQVPTDINALCDEYLRLAYHGMRAKDSSFNAKLETDFDDTIGEINVIPQDIGRVLLNLIANAFQAIDKDGKVKVSSKKKDGLVNISVSDNGPGIPDGIKDKIFQPFFTTKPTGSGTGLGLSLAYDIVKAHGGELKLETKLGEGSTFIIQLLN
jgi:signal transduction histidine kinase